MECQNGSFEFPYKSAQVVLGDINGGLYFHENTSISQGAKKLTLFGGKEKTKDQGKGYLTAIRELVESDEAGISLLPDNLRRICEDGPLEFEKGWFKSQIYLVLLSIPSTNMIQNCKKFYSLEDLNQTGNDYQWGTSFEHTRGLVIKALQQGN